MIIFDQLRVSDDGRTLFINAHVNRASYFDSVYIDTITIMTEDKVSEMAPELATEEYIYKKVITGEEKEINLVLNAADFNDKFAKATLSENLFFVYIKCKGTPGADTPCRLDEQTTLGVTFDEALLYQKAMNYTRGLANDCEIPHGLLDLILLWNGFKAAIETEHYISAIDFWKKLFRNKSSLGVTSTCLSWIV